MSLPAGIEDGFFGTSTKAGVTSRGELVVSAYAHDEVVAITLDTASTAYNFYRPKAGERFVITGILLTADSNVTGSALIDVYEGTSLTDTVIAKAILHVEILKNGYRDITSLNILASGGVFINAKTDDDDVFVTIMGYYVPL